MDLVVRETRSGWELSSERLHVVLTYGTWNFLTKWHRNYLLEEILEQRGDTNCVENTQWVREGNYSDVQTPGDRSNSRWCGGRAGERPWRW